MNLPNRKTIRRWGIYCGVSLVLGLVVIAFFLIRSLDSDILNRLHSLPAKHLMIMTFLVAGAWLSHGCRYWVLTRQMGHPLKLLDCIRMATSIEFAIAATPSGSGGAVARFALFSSRGVPLYISTSIFAVNILMDICVSLAMTVLALAVVATDREWQRILNFGHRIDYETLGWAGSAVLALLAAVAIAAASPSRIWDGMLPARFREGRQGRKLRYMVRRAQRFLRTSWRATKHLFGLHRGAVAADFILAICQWSCRYGILPALVVMFGAGLNPLPLFALQGLVFMAGLLLVLPGGGGGIEILSAMILPAFVGPDYVLIVLILWRFFTYYAHILA